MNLQRIKIGFALTGSHCTIATVIQQIGKLIAAGAQVTPVVSPTVERENTRFGRAEEVMEKLATLTGNKPIRSIVEAEHVGPGKLFDLLIVAPCTGNTLAKLANGITDTAVLMAVKAHLRNQRPVLLAIATNDGLGLNAKNIGVLLATRHIYLVPFGQDDPSEKPNSLVARMEFILPAAVEALQGKQIQPLLMAYKRD
ncbi:MAG: dipicolinate synthase subunit B [Bacillota bacterium]